MRNQIYLLAILAFVVNMNAQMGSGPPAIRNLYDIIFNDIKGSGQDINLIKQTFHEDWSTRPNPENWDCKGPKCGPGQEGMKQILGSWGTIFPDIYVERQYTLMCRFVHVPYIFFSVFQSAVCMYINFSVIQNFVVTKLPC